MNLDDLRTMSQIELLAKLKELQEQKFRLGFKHKTTMLDNPMLLKNVKKDIARVQTIIREKE